MAQSRREVERVSVVVPVVWCIVQGKAMGSPELFYISWVPQSLVLDPGAELWVSLPGVLQQFLVTPVFLSVLSYRTVVERVPQRLIVH